MTEGQIEGTAKQTGGQLQRQLGLFGATMMGLGSIVGTGVFVSIGIAAGIAGPAVIPAIAIAALVAMCNAVSSAQLAASHPVGGGTYEYGYMYLHPWLGFTAGWMFVCAKSASAATAALGFAGYALHALGVDASGLLVPLAVGASVVLTLVALGGIRRSNWINIAIVSVTLFSLVLFVIAGLPRALTSGAENLSPFFTVPSTVGEGGLYALLQASALMFVAYTGYARIATMSEEVRESRRTIPRAIVVSLIVSAALYIAVAAVAIATVGAERLSAATHGQAAPLEIVARQFVLPGRSLADRAGRRYRHVGGAVEPDPRALAGIISNGAKAGYARRAGEPRCRRGHALHSRDCRGRDHRGSGADRQR